MSQAVCVCLVALLFGLSGHRQGCLQVLGRVRVGFQCMCDGPAQIILADKLQPQQRVGELGAGVADEAVRQEGAQALAASEGVEWHPHHPQNLEVDPESDDANPKAEKKKKKTEERGGVTSSP